MGFKRNTLGMAVIGDLKTSVAAVLEGEDYRLRREEIDKGFAA